MDEDDPYEADYELPGESEAGPRSLTWKNCSGWWILSSMFYEVCVMHDELPTNRKSSRISYFVNYNHDQARRTRINPDVD